MAIICFLCHGVSIKEPRDGGKQFFGCRILLIFHHSSSFNVHCKLLIMQLCNSRYKQAVVSRIKFTFLCKTASC